MKRIVILGAGFAGLAVARELSCRRDRLPRETEILLIDRAQEQVYHPLLYEVATGHLPQTRSQSASHLCGGVEVPLADAIARLPGVMLHHGRVETVDFVRREVRLWQEPPLSYDVLVLALGSQTAWYGINGLQNYACALKNTSDALRIRDALHRVISLSCDRAGGSVDVVIGGAGASGVELAAELADAIKRLRRRHLLGPRCNVELTLVEAGPDILPSFQAHTRTVARHRLAALGVKIRTNTRIVKAFADTVHVQPAGSTATDTLASDVLVWAGGIGPSAALEQMDIAKDTRGRVIVDETLAVTNTPVAFALGDAAAIAPALATVALHQAPIVAENSVRLLRGEPLVAWAPQEHWWTFLPLGGGWGVLDTGTKSYGGPWMYVLHKLIDLRYFLLVLPRIDALRMWARGCWTYLRNDW